MEEKTLNDEEAEAFGLKRKILPNDENAEDATNDLADTEEIPLSAKLDEGYTEEGYARPVEFLPPELTDAEEDDESLVMLSPEEAERVVKEREEKAKKERELFEKLLKEGVAALENKDYEKARECFTQTNEIDADDLEVNVGYMRAYSEDFTATDDTEMLEEIYDQCFESAGKKFSDRIRDLFFDRLTEEKEKAQGAEEVAAKEYNAHYEERKEAYAARAAKTGGMLVKFGLPCALLVVAAIVFACLINAVAGNLFVILAVVCGVPALILLVPVLIFSKKAVIVARLQSENERIDSTEEGRELATIRKRIEFFDKCLESVR